MKTILGRLPAVRGRYEGDVSLNKLTWFRVGGPAQILFRPADCEDLQRFLVGRPAEIPYVTLGAGSNLLVRDEGVKGIVVNLRGVDFHAFRVSDTSLVEVGAGCLDRTVALECMQAGIGGLEFLVGIPGTIGGALRMNAGANGREMKDVLVYAEAFDPQGNIHRLSPAGMGFSYRHCSVPENWIFTRAVLRGETQSEADIKKRIDRILEERNHSQPIGSHTAGSTFRNPPGEKAWVLIDRAGCRGMTKGGAQVSTKHCNFLLNLGHASAEDIEELGEEVRKRVFDTSGIMLEWEIMRWGY